MSVGYTEDCFLRSNENPQNSNPCPLYPMVAFIGSFALRKFSLPPVRLPDKSASNTFRWFQNMRENFHFA